MSTSHIFGLWTLVTIKLSRLSQSQETANFLAMISNSIGQGSRQSILELWETGSIRVRCSGEQSQPSVPPTSALLPTASTILAPTFSCDKNTHYISLDLDGYKISVILKHSTAGLVVYQCDQGRSSLKSSEYHRKAYDSSLMGSPGMRRQTHKNIKIHNHSLQSLDNLHLQPLSDTSGKNLAFLFFFFFFDLGASIP